MANVKAQAWGFDLIIGVVIFLAGILFFYMYTVNYPTGEQEKYDGLLHEGELVSDSLLSEGSPENWNGTNVVRIGLVSDGRINNTKLGYFTALAGSNYNLTKRLFRIRNEYFVFFGDDVAGGIGRPGDSAANLAKITRVTIYDNNITTMNLHIWN